MDRRAFVRSMLAAAGTGAAAAALSGVSWPTTVVRPPMGDPIDYFGAHKVAGPAPRGVPLIPLRLNADGVLEGNPDVDGPGGNNILHWYRYCGHAGAPGLHADYEGHNKLQYFVADDKIKLGVPIWYEDRLGTDIRPGHFKPGEGAGFIWRSQGETGADVITGVIIRVPTPDALTATPPRFLPPAKPLRDPQFEQVLNEFVYSDGDVTLVALSTYCPHFCCVPGWKEATGAAVNVVDPVNETTAVDRMLCTCHNSVYHPFQFARYTFRPEVVLEERAAAAGGELSW